MADEFSESGYTQETKWTDVMEPCLHSSRSIIYEDFRKLLLRDTAHGGSHVVDTCKSIWTDLSATFYTDHLGRMKVQHFLPWTDRLFLTSRLFWILFIHATAPTGHYCSHDDEGLVHPIGHMAIHIMYSFIKWKSSINQHYSSFCS